MSPYRHAGLIEADDVHSRAVQFRVLAGVGRSVGLLPLGVETADRSQRCQVFTGWRRTVFRFSGLDRLGSPM
jgi:hypothetical protein